MPENVSYANCCEAGELAMRPDWPGTGRARPSGTARPLWEAPALSTVLIVTTAVDVVGNLLVILSVLRNRRLRNAGERHARCWGWRLVSTLTPPSASLRVLSPGRPVPYSLT